MSKPVPPVPFQQPTPEEIARLRELFPKGAPRIDYREIPLAIAAPITPTIPAAIASTGRAATPGDPDDDDDAEDEDDDEDERAGAAGSETGSEAGPEAAEGADADDGMAPIPIAISSEAPVLRYDWWEGEYYYEVLDHAKSSIDLSYAADGLPFIASHQAYDADQQHGIVEDIAVGDDRVLRGMMRPSRAPRSQEIAQDMRDGIRKKISVGYIVGDEYEQTKTKGTDIPTRRYFAWMPLEASTVPIPADYGVGVGRAMSAAGKGALQRFLALHPPAPKAKEHRMNQDTPAPANGAPAATPVVTVNDRSLNEAAAERVDRITKLATQHGCTDKLTEWLRSGASEMAVTQQINDILAARLAQPVQTSTGVELTEKQMRAFSYARVLMQDQDLRSVLGGNNVDIGFEREVVQEALKRTPMATGKGIFVPYVTQQRANVDSATSTTGGPFKFTQPGDFIDLLRNVTSVMRAGATVLPGLTGPVSFPKQTGAATASWVSENPGSDMARSNLTSGTVSLAFKTVQAATAVSRQALFSAASGNYDLEAIIRSDLAKVIALAIDLGALNGSGSGGQPLGVLQDTNVGAATALGTNGGTIAWSNIVDLETQVGNANAVGSSFAYLTNSKQRARGRTIPVLGNTTNGVPIWQGSPAFPDAGAGNPGADGSVNGYRAYMSNQVPSNLTKGTSTTICSAWVFGAFEHLLVGMFGAGFEVIVDPYTLKLQNMVDLTAWNFVDVADRYPVAFATLKDCL